MKLKDSLGFEVITVISISLILLGGMLSQPVYANSCAIAVSSTPSGANVYVDGTFSGTTPLTYVIGQPARVNLTVIKDGYEKQSQMVDVPLNAVVPVDVELTPLAQSGNTVTKTETRTITITSSTTSTVTTTATSVTTKTEATPTTTTITSTLLPAATTTVSATTTISTTITQMTETIGPITYAAVAVAIITILAAAILAAKRRSK